jgi:hypothetical protein
VDSNEEMIHCKYSCGNSLHKQCFDMYNTKRYNEITCLFCHKAWNDKKKYINLE